MAKEKRRGGVFDPSVVYIDFSRKQLERFFRKLKQHLMAKNNENNRT